MLWKINRLFISLCMFKLTCMCVSEKERRGSGGGGLEGICYTSGLPVLRFFHQQVIS